MIPKDIMDKVFQFEGGKANDPDDSGGKTNYGITQDTYNSYLAITKQHDKDVYNITKEIAEDIYDRLYWMDSKANLIYLADPVVALIHFDCAVNCGVGTAKKMLQEVLGVTKDGIIGPKTLSALDAVTLNPEERIKFRVKYLARRLDYYIDITVAKPSQTKFLPSWARRIHKLLVESYK